MPSNPLILCRPLLLLPSIFPSIRIFSNESALRIRWPKYWSFSFYITFSTRSHAILVSVMGDSAQSLQPCPTLCNPMDCSPPGSPVHRIFQARVLDWVAIDFSMLYSSSLWEKEMATHSCILAWRILWTGEPGGLLSIGSHRVRPD